MDAADRQVRLETVLRRILRETDDPVRAGREAMRVCGTQLIAHRQNAQSFEAECVQLAQHMRDFPSQHPPPGLPPRGQATYLLQEGGKT
jgi:hypothetical protein